jgi:hypothetical protein
VKRFKVEYGLAFVDGTWTRHEKHVIESGNGAAWDHVHDFIQKQNIKNLVIFFLLKCECVE